MARRDYRDEQGRPLPGVTTIIGATWAKPALMHWAAKETREGRDYKDTTARDAGSCAHAMIEAWFLRDQPFNEDEWSWRILDLAGRAYREFLGWQQRNRIRDVIAIEKPLVSKEFRCGGTLDCVAWLNGSTDLTYLDWKTGTNCYADYVIQGAAYRAMWNETQPRPIRSVHIVRFPTDGSSWEHYEVPESEDWEIPNKNPNYPAYGMPSLERGLRIFRQLRALYDERLAIGEVG